MNYQCAEANWTDVDLIPNHPCTVPTSQLNLGPVLAALGPAAAAAAAQLPCDLSFDCSSYLDFLANEAMWTDPGRGVRYTADVLTGSHSIFVPFPDYVFGTLDDDQLTIEASGTDFLGSWSVDAVFAPLPPQ